MPEQKHIWFHDTLSPERYRAKHPPQILLEQLEALPTIKQSQVDDLKLQTSHEGVPLRYWVSRVGFYDRPQVNGKGFEGSYPSITIEAYLDGSWHLVDGYQGHIV
jgi:hypothetical protein